VLRSFSARGWGLRGSVPLRETKRISWQAPWVNCPYFLPTRAIFHGAMTTTCCHDSWQAPWVNCPYLLFPTRVIFHGAMTTTCCHDSWQAPWVNCPYLPFPTRAIFHGAMTATCCHDSWQAPWVNCPYFLPTRAIFHGAMTTLVATIHGRRRGLIAPTYPAHTFQHTKPIPKTAVLGMDCVYIVIIYYLRTV
jgi:hypothetical protein